jgi:hypothetical protein
VYLYRTQTNGLVLSVDDGAEKAVGAAVWIGPVGQPTSFWGRMRDFLAWRVVDTYQFYDWVWYGESKLKASVCDFLGGADGGRDLRLLIGRRRMFGRRLWVRTRRRRIGIYTCLRYSQSIKARALQRPS